MMRVNEIKREIERMEGKWKGENPNPEISTADQGYLFSPTITDYPRSVLTILTKD